MRSFTLSDLRQQTGEVVDAARAAPVVLTEGGQEKVVMVSVEEWERLTYPRAYTMENLPDDLREELVAGLDAHLARK